MPDDEYDDNDDSADDWTPDREIAKQRRLDRRIYAEKVIQETAAVDADTLTSNNDSSRQQKQSRPSAYTDEEEAVIASMGGKTKSARREQGYLGDSTLQEIARDYSVPICYICDCLCLWGVPVPIDVHARLGDLVTGEQAFALLEAVNSLDVGILHDRYYHQNIVNLCAEWDIPIQDAFAMCMKEGWSLPFGVRTVLRVEQAEELTRVLGGV
jgi:hypothetical protein